MKRRSWLNIALVAVAGAGCARLGRGSIVASNPMTPTRKGFTRQHPMRWYIDTLEPGRMLKKGKFMVPEKTNRMAERVIIGEIENNNGVALVSLYCLEKQAFEGSPLPLEENVKVFAQEHDLGWSPFYKANSLIGYRFVATKAEQIPPEPTDHVYEPCTRCGQSTLVATKDGPVPSFGRRNAESAYAHQDAERPRLDFDGRRETKKRKRLTYVSPEPRR